MSQNKDEVVNTQGSAPPEPQGKPDEGMKPVDQGAQEKAAEEREKSGGYD